MPGKKDQEIPELADLVVHDRDFFRLRRTDPRVQKLPSNGAGALGVDTSVGPHKPLADGIPVAVACPL